MPNQTLSLLETKGVQLGALLNEMEEYFPPVNPKPNDSIAKIMYQAGQRSVVEWVLNKQEED
jgi:hypothetical protein|tara:strand:+ start:1441 stop:1626 length:186 start_codon:yes stop_codon:yes gene_type:complete